MKRGRKPTAVADPKRRAKRKKQARTKHVGQVRRHEVTDAQWKFIQPLLPQRTAVTGRPPNDARMMLNGILWVLRTGVPWRDMNTRYGRWQSVYDYFSNWRQTGVYDRVLQALHIRLDQAGQIDWDLWFVDGSSVRAARAAAGAEKKASSATRTNPRTTRWAARVADSQASSTWLLTAEACR
jgi:transposase